MKTITSLDGRKVSVTPAQKSAIETLVNSRKGGFATVHGYVPSTNWVVSPIQDINMITKFSTSKLYERKINALNNISFKDVSELIKQDDKLSALPFDKVEDIFNTRKQMLIDSMNKTLEGDRSDNYRLAHDTFYTFFDNGVKVNLKSKTVNGQRLLETNEKGEFLVNSIMVHYLPLSTKTIKEGERKVVNSGAPVRMSNIIDKLLNKKSVSLRTLSLKEGNFDSLTIDNKTLTEQDVSGYFNKEQQTLLLETLELLKGTLF
jgi:hypothetical protein